MMSRALVKHPFCLRLGVRDREQIMLRYARKRVGDIECLSGPIQVSVEADWVRQMPNYIISLLRSRREESDATVRDVQEIQDCALDRAGLVSMANGKVERRDAVRRRLGRLDAETIGT